MNKILFKYLCRNRPKVKNATCNTKVEGSNTATGTRRERKMKKYFFIVVREILVVHSLLRGAMLMPPLLELSAMDMVVPSQVSVSFIEYFRGVGSFFGTASGHRTFFIIVLTKQGQRLSSLLLEREL